MKRNYNIVLILFSVLILSLASGCTPKQNTAPNITLQGAMISSGNVTTEITPVTTLPVDTTGTATSDNKTTEPVDEKYKNVAYTITATEGDLVKLNLAAVDPDGDKLSYSYSNQFNSNGLWQTKDGDAGKYVVTVTASDGKSTATADVLVVINPSNKAPVIDCPIKINIKEGETVTLKCNFFDKENDPLIMEYSGWMSSPTYTTNYDSSGEHKVFVKVSDGFHSVTQTIVVTVEDVDRAPIFNTHLKDLTVVESDIVTIKPDITDPDNDLVTLTYSEPLSNKGTWKTKVGDAGTYPISVVASDGTLTTKESFTLTVKMLNTAPVMALIPNITIDEGEAIALKPEVVDREKDPISISYSGWIKSSLYTTTYDDAYPKGCSKPGCSATYKITITATDGAFEISQDVYVTVKDKNRAPVFVMP
jgi:hypothetical protein